MVLLSGGSEVYVARHAISAIIRKLAGLPQLPEDVDEQSIEEPSEVRATARELVDTILSEFRLLEE